MPGRERPDTVKKSQPEGNSVPSPAGAPARAESGRTLTLPSPANDEMLSRLAQLEASAAAAARQIDVPEPQPLSSQALEAEPLDPSAEAQSDRRSYRLSRP